MRAPRPPRRPRSLAGQLFVMQVVLVAVLVAGCALFAYVTDRAQAEESARQRAAATAKTAADSPSVVEATRTSRPEEQLQPYAERVRHDTGVTFVTIMDTDGVRWTHPDSSRIGGRFVGHIGEAARGRTFHETYTGTLGPSVRVVTPVWDEGRVVGLVSAGIAVETITAELRRELTVLLCVAGGALALGGVGTYVINARLRRHTHGMNAAELSRMHDYHQAVLHAVREGLMMLDGQKRVALMNDGARELLGFGGTRTGPRQGAGAGSGTEAVGRGVAELGLPPGLTGALLSGEPRVDEVHLTGDRVVVVNTSPVAGGEQRGTVVTLRDHTEIQSLAGELDSVRGFAEALRSQAHESANRLHTVISLIELGRTDEALDFATEELQLAQALTDEVVAAVAEPVVAALLLGKAAQANERGVELSLTPDSHIGDGLLPAGLPHRDLVTVLGNLIDNAVDAAAAHAPAPGSADTPGPGPAAATEPGTGPPSWPAAVPAAEGAGSRAGLATLPRGSAVTPRVRVAVRAESSDGGGTTLLLRVTDTGPGVPAEEAEAVFERGWSTKSAAGGGRGRGLGLALVRQTVDRRGGTVHVGTPAEGGAEFVVRLPLRGGVTREDAPPRADLPLREDG